jgi:hypothetical protein
MTSISDPAYSEEPVGGGAESVPDPVVPEFEEQPEQAAAPGPADPEGVER